MKSQIKAFQLADFIKIKPARVLFSDLLIEGDAEELFVTISDNQFLYVFKYGVVCFFNIDSEITQADLIQKIATVSGKLMQNETDEFQTVEIGNSTAVQAESIIVKQLEKETIKLIMFNVSQSVALDYYQSISEELLESTRLHTDYLEMKGKFSLSGKALKKFIGRVLNLRNKVVENLYVFEAPEVTWENEDLNLLDQDLKKHFDLKDRYRLVHEQLDIVKDNLELFKDFMFHRQSSKLEWIIIILILFEVADLFFLKLYNS